MAKSIHMLNKNIEVITACVQHIRGDLVSVHGIPSDHFASVDMTVALNSLLEAKRIIKHISVNGDNELSAHTTKFMKSIIDDVIWGVSSVQHHVDRGEHRLDSVVAAIFDSINELNEHVFCVDTVYSVSPVTHDVEVTNGYQGKSDGYQGLLDNYSKHPMFAQVRKSVDNGFKKRFPMAEWQYKGVMMNFVTESIVNAIKDENSFINKDDWLTLGENINKKL